MKYKTIGGNPTGQDRMPAGPVKVKGIGGARFSGLPIERPVKPGRYKSKRHERTATLLNAVRICLRNIM